MVKNMNYLYCEIKKNKDGGANKRDLRKMEKFFSNENLIKASEIAPCVSIYAKACGGVDFYIGERNYGCDYYLGELFADHGGAKILLDSGEYVEATESLRWAQEVVEKRI